MRFLSANPVLSLILLTNTLKEPSITFTLPFNAQNKQVYYYFIENWGTSVITDEIEGGLLQYVCIVQSAVWTWGGQGKVSQSFVKQQMDSMFRDTMHATSYASPVLTQNSICEFFCVGGNPESCPNPQTADNSSWPSTIWSDPQTVKLDVVPLPEVIADNEARQSLQIAIYSYYEDQIAQYSQFEACSTCLPTVDSFAVAFNVPFESATTVHAGTCSTAIRVVAWGSCTFIMRDNDRPINGGTEDCLYTNEALWGVAAVYGMTDPIVEWIVSDVEHDHTFISHKCDYPDIECDYWTGHFSLFCV